MSLPHALLTSLIEKPSAGLDLARRFDRSIGFFWPASHQQIYRELARLEAAGWVSSAPEAGRGRKRLYTVLPAGRVELRRWVEESTEPRAQRDEFMVRLRAEAAIGPTALAKEARQRLALHEARLVLYREIEARDFAKPALTRAEQLQYLILKTGIMQEEMGIAVAREAMGILG